MVLLLLDYRNFKVGTCLNDINTCLNKWKWLTYVLKINNLNNLYTMSFLSYYERPKNCENCRHYY